MSRPKESENSKKPRRPPGTTPEARENQMIALAVDLAEKQLSEGTASAQVVTHYLKLSTQQHQLEKEKLRLEAQLLKARTDAIENSQNSKELFEEAIKAMRTYTGGGNND